MDASCFWAEDDTECFSASRLSNQGRGSKFEVGLLFQPADVLDSGAEHVHMSKNRLQGPRRTEFANPYRNAYISQATATREGSLPMLRDGKGLVIIARDGKGLV